jgi:hypothetical protein
VLDGHTRAQVSDTGIYTPLRYRLPFDTDNLRIDVDSHENDTCTNSRDPLFYYPFNENRGIRM